MADFIKVFGYISLKLTIFLCFSFIFCSSLVAMQEQVVADLRNPSYENGLLSTEEGGTLITKNLRIQAQNIRYIKKLDDPTPQFTVTCHGKLLIDYHDWTLVADSLFYDFASEEGFLVNARTADPPWYIGGREVRLNKDKLIVLDGFITTSEGEVQDVVLRSSLICLTANHVITARNIHIRVNEIPIFWLPYLELGCKDFKNFPFTFKFGWGGFLGSYVSVLYQFLAWRDFKANARFDAFFGKGVGLGIETAYAPSWRATRLLTRSYYAHDIALDDPSRHDRYRFQGIYSDCIANITIDGMYDFVSDAEMASNYTVKDFDLQTAGQTQLTLRRQERNWVSRFYTRLRLNDFQSVNQELPSWLLQWRPFVIPHTGIVCEQNIQASFLNYVFSEDVHRGRDFSSMRLETHPIFYRPFNFNTFTFTPEAGFIGIAYSNTPDEKGNALQAVGQLGADLTSAFSRTFGCFKHVIEPYIHYSYLTSPTSGPDHHYIFSIDDGLHQLNILKFGIQSSLFRKDSKGAIFRPFWIEGWANAFFTTPHIAQTIPRGYLNMEWTPNLSVIAGLEGGWNFEEQQLDFVNVRLDWTVNENCAWGVELRHRSRFDWRKADFYNFILESSRSQEALLQSPLSDQRNTFLMHLFCRPHPDWTAELDLRHGWHRRVQGPYLEYLIEVSRIVFQHWKLTFGYEKKERDNRFSFSLLLNP